MYNMQQQSQYVDTFKYFSKPYEPQLSPLKCFSSITVVLSLTNAIKSIFSFDLIGRLLNSQKHMLYRATLNVNETTFIVHCTLYTLFGKQELCHSHKEVG